MLSIVVVSLAISFCIVSAIYSLVEKKEMITAFMWAVLALTFFNLHQGILTVAWNMTVGVSTVAYLILKGRK